MTSDPVALVCIQSLHGIGFGAFWIAGVALFSELAPPNLSRSAQSLLPASTFGVGYLLAMAGASWVLARHPPPVLFQLLAIISLMATAGSIVVASRIKKTES
jgi:PPP family 3-phenylpropionic acid transporter